MRAGRQARVWRAKGPGCRQSSPVCKSILPAAEPRTESVAKEAEPDGPSLLPETQVDDKGLGEDRDRGKPGG